MFIGEICNREVVIASRDTSVNELAQLMREQHVGSVVITELQNNCQIPIGIITDRDLVIELLSKGIDTEKVTAGDIMNGEIVTVRESNHIGDTLKLMRGKGIRRIPVVNDENVLVGILTVDDLLDVVISELDDIVNLVNVEQKREKQLRQ